MTDLLRDILSDGSMSASRIAIRSIQMSRYGRCPACGLVNGSRPMNCSSKEPPARPPLSPVASATLAAGRVGAMALEGFSNNAGPSGPKSKAGGRRGRRFSSDTILITGHHKLQIRKLFQMTFLGSGIAQGK